MTGTVATPVTVTATLSDGLAWGPDAGRVDVGQPDDGDVRGRRCPARRVREVAPVAPTVTQAVCVAWCGPAADGDVGDDRRDHLHDGQAGTVCAPLPTSVTVTATLTAHGVGWPATLPTGWTETTATTATYPGTFADASCTPVHPVDPTATQATCTNGEVTAPTFVLADHPGGHLCAQFRPARMTGRWTTPVTVTATLSDGLGWGHDGRRVDAVSTRRRRRSTVTLIAASCAEVTPVAPTVTQARVCNGVVRSADGDVGDDRRDHLHAGPDERRTWPLPPSVTVTATLDGQGVGWPDTLPTGLDRDRLDDSARTR